MNPVPPEPAARPADGPVTGQPPAAQPGQDDTGLGAMTGGDLIALHHACLTLMHAYQKYRAIPLAAFEHAAQIAGTVRERLDEHVGRDRPAGAG